jgi:SAM-dependent methyltransferase
MKMNSRVEEPSTQQVPEGETSARAVGEPSYFEFQAMFGATKHGGGLRATRELSKLCHINESSYVLDVGCGVGMTPCDLTRWHGCRVLGVDIRESMIDQARHRAQREGVEHLVEFRVADAQNLPFEDALFDAVIGESVTALLDDKATGIGQYVRVTKPGGYVGLNEMTWLKTGPPAVLVDYYYRTTGARPETSEDWQQLLQGAGLTEVVVRTSRMKVVDEYIDGLRRFGVRDLLSTGLRFLSLTFTSPAFRRYARGTIPSAGVVKAIFEYLGYGIYAGRKPPTASRVA